MDRINSTIIGWTEEIDAVTDTFQGAFGKMSAEELNWKPEPQSWSIAQIVDHLITTNETYFPIIRQIREGTYSTPRVGRIGWIRNFLGNLILKSVSPDYQRKTKTFPQWEPSSSALEGDIIIRFADHQGQLATLIKDSADLLRKKTVISSPINRNIVYTLEKAFEIIVTHEKRHLQQALRVKDAMEA